MIKLLSALLIAFVLLISASTALAGPISTSDVPELPAGTSPLPEPGSGGEIGTIITSENAQFYKKIIIPPIYSLVRSDVLAIDAAKRLRYVWRLDDDWQRSTDKASDKRPALGSAGTIGSEYALSRGFLFGGRSELLSEWSQITDQTDQKKSSKSRDELAYKVLWNVNSSLWSLGLINYNFTLTFLNASSSLREVRGEFSRVYPAVLDSSFTSEQLFREKIEFSFPRAISDHSWLTFRFKGADEDMLWVYSPVNKKPRQITGSNRSDALIASGVSPDDFFAWSGKMDFVSANLKDRVVALTPFPSTNFKALTSAPNACFHIKGSTNDSSFTTLGSKWNYQNRRFPGRAPWVPSEAVWVPRELWQIELTSKDPYSLYGRQMLYVDSAMMLPVYKIVYDRSGRHWKTIIFSYGLAATEDRKRKSPYPAFMVVIDKVAQRSYVMDFSKISYCNSYTEDIRLADFSPKKLGRIAEEELG